MKKITSLIGTMGGCETMPMRGPSIGGGWSALKASRDSTSIDDLVCSAMVLARGVNDIVGWKAKALG